MVRDSGISATKPVFPSYLLPSFGLLIPARWSLRSSSKPSSHVTTASTKSHVYSNDKRLSRVASDTLRCASCSTDVAFASQIISKGFTGRYGRAFLVSPPVTSEEQTLLNIRLGRNEGRQLVTGWHVVADITCSTCNVKLGWKYVDAKDAGQKYKVGKFILEKARVVNYRHWNDVRGQSSVSHAVPKEISEYSTEEVAFDSGDDEECDDIFAGTWDADAVAHRRSTLVSHGR